MRHLFDEAPVRRAAALSVTESPPMKGRTMNRRIRGAALPLSLSIAALSAQAQSDANTAKIFNGYALTQLTAAGLLYNPQAKATYNKALGSLKNEPWLANLDGPSNEYRPVRVAGADYMLGSTCKNHDCYDNTVVLLWSGVQNVVYGKVVQKGKSTLIGAPPPAVAAELETHWKKEFRSQPK